MKNVRSTELEREMAVGSQDVVPAEVSVLRLGFDPTKLSEKSNRQTKAKSRNQKKRNRPLLGFAPPKKRYIRNCDEKTRFKSLEHAKEAKERIRYISAIESLDGKPATKLPSRAYACGNCKGWHLSSRPDLFEIQFELAA